MGMSWAGKMPRDYSGSMGKKAKEPYVPEDYICVDNSGGRRFVVLQNFTAEGIPMWIHSELPLTIGKKYKKLYDTYDITVINDFGEQVEYSRDKFEKITVQNWRDAQLDKLLK